eukprot:861752-Amphidinium_carterae.2
MLNRTSCDFELQTAPTPKPPILSNRSRIGKIADGHVQSAGAPEVAITWATRSHQILALCSCRR